MFTILDYSSALEYSIIRRYTNIVYYYYYFVHARTLCRYGCMYCLAVFVLVCVDVMV